MICLTGIRSLDKSSFTIFVDGVSSTLVGSATLYPASGVWATDHVLEVTVSDSSFNCLIFLKTFFAFQLNLRIYLNITF